MSRGGAHFTGEELERVLAQYNLGRVQETHTLATGNRRSPKKILVTERGTFVLKRRARGKDDMYHVAFAHSIQTFLQKKGFAVSPLAATHDNTTVLRLDGHTYELFHFVPGSRFDGSVEAVRDAGRQLARMHEYFDDFACGWQPLKLTYHDSFSVRSHLRTIGSEQGPHTPGKGWGACASALSAFYNAASGCVNGLGFNAWPHQIVHGDWHPGNMLFAEGKVTCVLDFDSAKMAPMVTDVANGTLQFSIVGGRANPAEWPDHLDREKLRAFVSGYINRRPLEEAMLRSLPDLMVEILVAEAVTPIAATGYFGHLSGLDFLKMILRKCRWIDDNRAILLDDVFAKG
ncbi:MAG: phosphotransferase [Phycisphaerae bacterium]|nr:phosphotransferase [Phycisphaerae bacterium]